MKSFQFNKIFIVQSLSLDPKNSGFRIGDALKKDIDAEIAKLQSINNLTCEIVEIHSTTDWDKFISDLTKECTGGSKPILHFICHGNQTGLALDGVTGLLKWEDFLSSLEKVNVATSNNLFVSLCVCYGFWSLLHILDQKYRMPFCGVVACPYPLHVFTAAKCFPKFYAALLSQKNVEAAKNALIQEINKFAPPSATPADKMYVNFADELFKNAVVGDYKKNRMNMRSRIANAKVALRDAGKDPNDASLVKRFLDAEDKQLPELYKELRDYKLMLDLYPGDKARYDLPDDIHELIKNS